VEGAGWTRQESITCSITVTIRFLTPSPANPIQRQGPAALVASHLLAGSIDENRAVGGGLKTGITHSHTPQ